MLKRLCLLVLSSMLLTTLAHAGQTLTTLQIGYVTSAKEISAIVSNEEVARVIADGGAIISIQQKLPHYYTIQTERNFTRDVMIRYTASGMVIEVLPPPVGTGFSVVNR